MLTKNTYEVSEVQGFLENSHKILSVITWLLSNFMPRCSVNQIEQRAPCMKKFFAQNLVNYVDMDDDSLDINSIAIWNLRSPRVWVFWW